MYNHRGTRIGRIARRPFDGCALLFLFFQMMGKFFNILLVVVVMSLPIEAGAIKLRLKKDPSPMIDYGVWVSSSELPEKKDGVQQFYPSTETVVTPDNPEFADTVAVIRGYIEIEGLTPRQVMLAAMVYASDNFDREEGKEGFEAIDYDGNRFRMLLKTTCGTNANETTYTRSLTITARDGGLDFVATEIDCRYRENGLIPRTLRLEKLHPDKNKRHDELVRELVEVNSAYLARMGEYVASRSDISAPHLAKIKVGADVAEGMTEDEVTILLGPPVNKRRSGDRHRWIYSNDCIVIFTDGTVSKIIK